MQARANAQRLQGVQERYVASQPRFIPEQAHETNVDMGLPAGWYRDDSFAGRDETETKTGQFLLRYKEADAAERQARERRLGRRVRRAIAAITGGAR